MANLIQLAFTLISISALKRFGRKQLILVGNLTLGIFDVIISVMFLIILLIDWQPAIYIVLAFIFLFMMSYGITIGPAIWLYVPEIIPPKLVPWATCMNWLGCSICIIATPFIVEGAGSPYPVFLGFGVLTIMFFICNFKMLVESKGRTRKELL